MSKPLKKFQNYVSAGIKKTRPSVASNIREQQGIKAVKRMSMSDAMFQQCSLCGSLGKKCGKCHKLYCSICLSLHDCSECKPKQKVKENIENKIPDHILEEMKKATKKVFKNDIKIVKNKNEATKIPEVIECLESSPYKVSVKVIPSDVKKVVEFNPLAVVDIKSTKGKENKNGNLKQNKKTSGDLNRIKCTYDEWFLRHCDGNIKSEIKNEAEHENEEQKYVENKEENEQNEDVNVEDTEYKNNHTDKIIAEMKEVIENEEKKMNEEANKSKEIEAQLLEKTTKIKNLEKLLKEKELNSNNKIALLTKENKYLKEKITNLDKSLEEYKLYEENNSKKNAEIINKYKLDILELQRALVEKVNLIKLSEEAQQLEKESPKSSERLEELKTKISELEEALNNKQSEHNSKLIDFKRKFTEKEIEYASKIEDMGKENTSIKDNLKKTQILSNKNEIENRLLKDENTKIKQKLTENEVEKNNKILALSTEISNLQLEIEKKSRENTEISEKNKHSEEEHTKANEKSELEKKALKDQINIMQKAFTANQKQISKVAEAIKKENNALKYELVNMNVQFRAKNLENFEIKKTLDDLKKENSELKEDVNNLNTNLNEKEEFINKGKEEFAKANRILRTQINNLQQEIKQKDEKEKENCGIYEKQIDGYKEQINNLLNDIEKIKSESESNYNLFKSKETEFKKCQTLNDEISNIKMINEDLLSQIEALKSSGSKIIENKNQEIENLNSKIQILNEEKLGLAKLYDTNNKDKEDKIDLILKEVEGLRTDLEKEKENSARYYQELVVALEKVNAYDKMNSELKQKIEDLERQIQLNRSNISNNNIINNVDNKEIVEGEYNHNDKTPKKDNLKKSQEKRASKEKRGTRKNTKSKKKSKAKSIKKDMWTQCVTKTDEGTNTKINIHTANPKDITPKKNSGTKYNSNTLENSQNTKLYASNINKAIDFNSNILDRNLISKTKYETTSVNCLLPLPSGNFLSTSIDNNYISVFSGNSGKLIQRIKELDEESTISLTLISDKTIMAGGYKQIKQIKLTDNDKECQIVSVISEGLIGYVNKVLELTTFDLVICEEAAKVSIFRENKNVYKSSSDNGRYVLYIKSILNEKANSAIQLTEKYFAVSTNNSLRVFDVNSFEQIKAISNLNCSLYPNSLILLNDYTLAIGLVDGIALFDIDNLRCTKKEKCGEVYSLENPDDNILLVGENRRNDIKEFQFDKRGKLLNVYERKDLGNGYTTSMCICENGNLVLGQKDGLICLTD